LPLKQLLLLLITVCVSTLAPAQDQASLDYFIDNAIENAPILRENRNLLKIGELQANIIKAQNNGLQVNATSEVLFAPYFNSNGRAIDVTPTPSANAYGYDVGITNGGLYSAQLNITKNLFNRAVTDNLLFQNKIQNNSVTLSSEEFTHNLVKNITDAYVMAYQLQLQEGFTKEVLKDLNIRLQVVELLVKRAVLMESDYLLLQLDIESFKELDFDTIDYQLKVPLWVSIDPFLADVLINNLITNAIKHSKKDEKVVVETDKSSFTISNSGERSLAQPEKLFQRFYREDNATQSTGLGLAIVKKICDYYNFKISYQFKGQKHFFSIDF
jgi:hypothetical protein